MPSFWEVDPKKIYSVSIMPCLAKKQEAALPTMDSAGAGPDVDAVLTTRELSRMIRSEHILPAELKEEEFDEPLGVASGAGIIFGATGGVMEAALRSAYYLVTGKNLPPMPSGCAGYGTAGRKPPSTLPTPPFGWP